MKKQFAFLWTLAILSGALPASLQAAAWTRLLPGRFLYAGGVDV